MISVLSALQRIEKVRNEKLDIMKGIAMLLVVLGHVTDVKYQERNIVYNICYSFHTAMFIFISGYLVGNVSRDRINGQWIKKRFFRLMIPYFIWCVITNGYRQGIGNIFDNLLYHMFVNPYVWFLVVVFLCDFVIFVSNLFNRYRYLVIACMWFGFSFLYLIKKAPFMYNIAVMLPYFLVGWYLGGHRELLEKLKKNKVIYYMGAMYIPGMFLYRFGSEGAYDFAQKIMSVFIEDMSYENLTAKYSVLCVAAVIWFFSRFIIGYFGIAFVWSLLTLLKGRLTCIKKFIKLIGAYTMEIYILHDFFYVNVSSNRLADTITNYVIVIALSLLAGIIIKRFARVRRIFFGV